MLRFAIFSAAIVLALARGVSAQQRDALTSAAEALGVDHIKTLQFIASGATFTVGQNFTPSDPWPRVTLWRYTVLVNYETGSMRQELMREMGAAMPRGGVPFTGELHQIQAMSGPYAWNIPIPEVPEVGALPVGPCTPPEAGGTSPTPASAPESHAACMLMLWATPQGFVKAALANNATVAKVKGGTEITFVIGGKYKMTGIINSHNQVERVRTWVDQSLVGDMLVETQYGDYRDFGSVQFPAHILQKQDGFPSLDLSVSSVMANPKADITPPDNVRNVSPSSITVNSQKLADGVFWLTGGSHHSLAIEMKDHIVLVDAPNGEPRASAVIAKAKELIPGKPIRYVVAMHHHWDHMGGIRTAIDEGAIIVTHKTNQALLERIARAPHTIKPDRLSISKRPLKLKSVGDEGTLTDGTRTIKLYAMTAFDHTDDMLMVYLPYEKILAEADAYTPPETPTKPLIAPKVPYAAALYNNIQRLKLDVQTIAPFHGARIVSIVEVGAQARSGCFRLPLRCRWPGRPNRSKSETTRGKRFGL